MIRNFLLLVLITISITSIWITNNLSSKLNLLEQQVLFNNAYIREVDGMLGKVEDNLATWIEQELGKIHLRLNNTLMGN